VIVSRFILGALLTCFATATADAQSAPVELKTFVVPELTNAFDRIDAKARNCELNVAVFQFTPKKPAQDLDQKLDLADSIFEVSRILNSSGPVRIIYNGTRELVAQAGGAFLDFDSLESRPAFAMVGAADHPAAPLGLKLKLTILPSTNFAPETKLEFAWSGALSCSPELLENAKWEKGLMLLFNVANGLGAGFYDEPKKKGIRQSGGINVVSLFSKKAKAAETGPVNCPRLEPELSYYKTSTEEYHLTGHQTLGNGSILMKALNAPEPGKPSYYLLLQYTAQ
jgi:hypothetical protein